MSRMPLGEQELELLRYVADNGPLTVGQASEGFGEPRGLARSTILTVMERLRKKGYLTRVKRDGVYRYASPVAKAEVLRGVVSDFVERALAGSLSPFVTYLAETPHVTEEELAQLQQVVAKLRAERKGADE